MANPRLSALEAIQHEKDEEAYAELRGIHLENIFEEYEREHIRWVCEATWKRDRWAQDLEGLQETVHEIRRQVTADEYHEGWVCPTSACKNGS